MLRSLCLCMIHARQSLIRNETGWIVQRALPSVSQCARSLHLSTHKFSDDYPPQFQRPKRNVQRSRHDENTQLKSENVELKRAAENAAKSLSGDWTRTAEELMKRLQLQDRPNTHGEDSKQKTVEEPVKSLLQSMEVGRSFKGKLRGGRLVDPNSNTDAKEAFREPYYRRDTPSDGKGKERVARRVSDYKDLFQAQRLGIFDAEKLKAEGNQQLVSREPVDLWTRIDAERTRSALGALPSNAFEEMIQWTKAGKLWKFPINNEADMHEERKYKFHDHVFLERHLSEFPNTGPIRKFMELVTLGLSKNPWVTVNEKIEHIQWFADYFRKKQDILEASIGEQGIMKKTDGKLE